MQMRLRASLEIVHPLAMIATSILAACGIAIAIAGSSIAVAAPLALIALTTAAWRPDGAVAACMLALPYVFRLHQLPKGEFTLLELGILVTVAGFGLHMLLFRRHDIVRTLVAVSQNVEIVVPIVGILVATAISLFNLANPAYRHDSLREVRVVIIEPLALLAVMLVVFERRGARIWTVTCLVGMAIVLSFWAMGQVFTGSGVVDATSVARATASYPHPNNLGLFFDRSILILVPLVIARPRTPWLWAVLALQFIGVGLTFSRGSLVALAAGCVLALAMVGYRRQILGLLGTIAIILVFFFAFARARLFDPGGGGHEPTRFALWRSSWQMIRDHPIFGVGPDQFLYAYWRRYVEPEGWPERYTSHPHNMILDVWLRLGVIGLASFSTLALGIISQLVQLWRASRDDWLVRGSAVALFGGVVHGMFDNSFFLADLATLTWLFVALIASATARDHPGRAT